MGSNEAEFGTYIGERRILVSMVSIQGTPYAGDGFTYSPIVKSAWRSFGIGTPKPYEKKVIYLATTRMDMMLATDKMEWCKVGHDLKQLAASLHLTLGPHGVIAGERITWTDRRYDFPTSRLVPNFPSQEAAAVVAQAVP